MKFLVPNYSCLQNPWLGGYRHQIPVLSVLNWICWTPPRKKFLVTPLSSIHWYSLTFFREQCQRSRFSDRTTRWMFRSCNTGKGKRFGSGAHLRCFQWVPGFFLGVKRPEHEVKHSALLVARLRMGGAVILLSLYAFKARREKKNFCLLRGQTHDPLASIHSVLQGKFVLLCKLEKSATVLVWINFRLGCVRHVSRIMPLAAIAVCGIRHKTLLQVSYIFR
jgi:hypothetical protein